MSGRARRAVPAARPLPARLRLFAVFHLNLAFSSIEEEDRAAIIERCYWPLLALASVHGPIGIEASGYTLEDIEARDPAWIRRLRDLIAAGKAELIGSGYAQLIGPLVPARVVAANLAIGNEIYRRFLGIEPSLALVNEQAYAGGLVGHYLDAGYRALLMDWDNPSAAHPHWPAELRYRPQTAQGADGRAIALLWTNTVAFQKLQRHAHGDIGLEEYLDFVISKRGETDRTLCLYASDGEIFDFRPGRFRTEEALSGASEWSRIADAFAALGAMPGLALVRPSEALAFTGQAPAPLRLETAAQPVPVKKQRKYNLTRWAVTGRDNIGINAACMRLYHALEKTVAPEAEWKTLCRLWGSDYRTHITERRWRAYCATLAAAETRWGTTPSPIDAPRPPAGKTVSQRFIDIETPALTARLDRRRGLAIQSLAFGGPPLVGGLPHGHFDDIALQADWYTGDCVFEQPGEHKITDLEWADSTLRHENGDIVVAGTIPTPLGPVEKTLRFHAHAPRVDFDLVFHWEDFGKGSLRLGHITLLPDAFDWTTLSLVTHNGGFIPEHFDLHGDNFDHGAPVSFLVSASSGLGMTEGWACLSDGKRGLRVEVDRTAAPLLGLLAHRETGGSLFCQLMLSMLELDDTRKPSPYRKGPRRARFSLIGTGPETSC